MGSGSSTLTIEQKAHVAKLMKEKYEIIKNNKNETNETTNENLTEQQIQQEMEKYYNELILSLQPSPSLDILRKEQIKKKNPTRRRSYGEDSKLKNKKDLPPRPQVKGTTTSTTTSSSTASGTSSHETGGNHHHIQDEHQNNANGNEPDSHHEENGKFTFNFNFPI